MKYFAYASNMSSEELGAWCPGAEFIAVAKLPEHRLDFTRYSEKRQGGVADVVPSGGSEVWGALYELPDEELPTLDRKESAPTAYRHEYVDVVTQSGERVRAMTYMVIDKVPTEAPSRDYMDLILRGARERGLPSDYVSALAQIGARDDDPAGGAAQKEPAR